MEVATVGWLLWSDGGGYCGVTVVGTVLEPK